MTTSEKAQALQDIASIRQEIDALLTKKAAICDQYATENGQFKVGDIVWNGTGKGRKKFRVTIVRVDDRLSWFKYHGVLIKTDGTESDNVRELWGNPELAEAKQ